MKQALPISDIKELIERRVKRTSIEETLNYFSELYDKTFNTLIAIAKKFSSKTSSDDTIFGDAALFLAMGWGGSKYMAKQIVDLSRKEEK